MLLLAVLALLMPGALALHHDLSPPTRLSTVFNHHKVVVCYVGTWAFYRPGNGSFDLQNLDPTLCTHLVYSFAGLDNKTFTIRSLDPNLDLEADQQGQHGWFKKMTDFRKRHAHVKVLLAIGGWNEGSENYSEMVASPSTRQTFINSVSQFIRKYGFDGFDLDWEFPARRGGQPEDKANYVSLVKELRQEFTKHGWLLTAALGVAPNEVNLSYDVATLSKLLDHVHLMTYDYHGSWDKVTGHNAPLSPLPGESEANRKLNLRSSVELFMKLGAPANKLVLGLPFYGRTFLLADASKTGLGAPALDRGFKGPYTRENGFLGYNEICEVLKGENTQSLEGFSYAVKGPWKQEMSQHEAPYMYCDDHWVSFDDPESIALKAKFSAEKGLKGVMIWSIDTDDFRGACGGETFPLLRAANYALHEAEEALKKSTTTTTTTTAATTSDSDNQSFASKVHLPFWAVFLGLLMTVIL